MFTDWWFEFLTTKGGKGVSKDTWTMVRPTFYIASLLLLRGMPLRSQFLDFVRTIDSKFEEHDYEGGCTHLDSDTRFRYQWFLPNSRMALFHRRFCHIREGSEAWVCQVRPPARIVNACL